MIALAVAALLTISALAIWAAKTIRRPVDWSGPLTGGPTRRALNRDRIRRLDNRPPPPSEMDRLLAGQCTHGHGTTDRCPTCSITLRMIAGINQMATAIFGIRPDTPATTRALRASERDDHRREGQ